MSADKSATLVGMDGRLLASLHAGNFRTMLPIQAAAWRELYSWPLERDFLLKAGTGSGKTLAYALPLLNFLAKRITTQSRVMVIVPSVELAKQVACALHLHAQFVHSSVAFTTSESSNSLTARLGFRRMHSYASTTQSSIRRVVNSTGRLGRMKFRNDICVSTPGQLLLTVGSHEKNGMICVVDESDRLLRQLHQDWLGKLNYAIAKSKNIGKHLVGERSYSSFRFLLVSATLSSNGKETQALHLRAPRNICEKLGFDAPDSRPVGLLELCVVVPSSQKLNLLFRVLDLFGRNSTLVVTNSVQQSHKLRQLLHKSVPQLAPVEFDSRVPKLGQTHALEAFRSGFSKIMIASDIATRGLDMQGVDLVISYDMPLHAETYIHRIGRTARSGARGTAITFCCARDMDRFGKLLGAIDRDKVVKRFEASHFLSCEPAPGIKLLI